MYYEITKQFNLSIGHRVWSQHLDPILSCGAKNKCRHLHGHNITVSVTLQSQLQYLTDGLVLDFGNLAFFKSFLDKALDHKFLLDLNDPILEIMFPTPLQPHLKLHTIYPTKLGVPTAFKYISTNPDWTPEQAEYYNSFVFMEGVPTAELLSYNLYTLLNSTLITPKNLIIKSVSVQETMSAGALTLNEESH